MSTILHKKKNNITFFEQYENFKSALSCSVNIAKKVNGQRRGRGEIHSKIEVLFTGRLQLRRVSLFAAHTPICYTNLKKDRKFSCSELLQTLREYKLYQIPGVGFLHPVVDTLQNAFDIRTDYQINTRTMMKNIFHYTKS